MKKLIYWLLRLIPAVILLQTLYFKFTPAPESVYIFAKVGIGDAGRIGSGILELIAAILLLIPRTSVWGALIGLVTMASAIASHYFILGIVVQNDGGLLFALALIVFIFCAIIVLQNLDSLNPFKKQ